MVEDTAYLKLLGVNQTSLSAGDLWRRLLLELRSDDAVIRTLWQPLECILECGNLSERLRDSLGERPSEVDIRGTYHRLADCLTGWQSFPPHPV